MGRPTFKVSTLSCGVVTEDIPLTMSQELANITDIHVLPSHRTIIALKLKTFQVHFVMVLVTIFSVSM
jgi:hypothetical protein